MRFTFCFSRSCCPYPASILRRAAPCCPGGFVPRFSIEHEGLKQRSPFKNNFPPSRRHNRHTASLYLAINCLREAILDFRFWILHCRQSSPLSELKIDSCLSERFTNDNRPSSLRCNKSRLPTDNPKSKI